MYSRLVRICWEVRWVSKSLPISTVFKGTSKLLTLFLSKDNVISSCETIFCETIEFTIYYVMNVWKLNYLFSTRGKNTAIIERLWKLTKSCCLQELPIAVHSPPNNSNYSFDSITAELERCRCFSTLKRFNSFLEVQWQKTVLPI